MMGTIRQIKVLYWRDSCRAMSLSRIGRNSISDTTKVMIDRAKLTAISACVMLVNRSLRGYRGRRAALRRVAQALQFEVASAVAISE